MNLSKYVMSEEHTTSMDSCGYAGVKEDFLNYLLVSRRIQTSSRICWKEGETGREYGFILHSTIYP